MKDKTKLLLLSGASAVSSIGLTAIFRQSELTPYAVDAAFSLATVGTTVATAIVAAIPAKRFEHKF